MSLLLKLAFVLAVVGLVQTAEAKKKKKQGGGNMQGSRKLNQLEL